MLKRKMTAGLNHNQGVAQTLLKQRSQLENEYKRSIKYMYRRRECLGWEQSIGENLGGPTAPQPLPRQPPQGTGDGDADSTQME